MKTQQILEALDTDEKVVKLAKALHKNKADIGLTLQGRSVIIQPQGEKCFPGYYYDEETKTCILDVGP